MSGCREDGPGVPRVATRPLARPCLCGRPTQSGSSVGEGLRGAHALAVEGRWMLDGGRGRGEAGRTVALSCGCCGHGHPSLRLSLLALWLCGSCALPGCPSRCRRVACLWWYVVLVGGWRREMPTGHQTAKILPQLSRVGKSKRRHYKARRYTGKARTSRGGQGVSGARGGVCGVGGGAAKALEKRQKREAKLPGP